MKEKQIKTTMRYHFTPIRMVVKKRDNNVGEHIEKLEPSHTANDNVKWYGCFVHQSDSSSEG